MVNFGEIYKSALVIHSEQKLASRLTSVSEKHQIENMADSYYLSMMSRRIFRAGLKHSMVDKKWPHFENVFQQFDLDEVRTLSDDDLDLMMQDRGLIRHWGKLSAMRENAQVMHDISQNHGSFGRFLAEWKSSEIVKLWYHLKLNFRQLGGNSAPYFLRMVGKDTFLLTNDVLSALKQWDVYEGPGQSMKDREYLQSCFNYWVKESHRPLCQVSQIMALSVDC